MKNQEIKILSLGCRLNALEAEKIRAMLRTAGVGPAIVVNTCSVTNEAQAQSRQLFHKIMRENPGAPAFVTGCGATLRPGDFDGAAVIANKDKFNLAAYNLKQNGNEVAVTPAQAGVHCQPPRHNLSVMNCDKAMDPGLRRGDEFSMLTRDKETLRVASFSKMQTKGFVQIGDGCDRACAYCITRILRGRAVCFSYERILADARALVENGYEEIILTGVNIADYSIHNSQFIIHNLAELCRRLLDDLPGMRALTLSSLDPAGDIESILDLIAVEPRMTRHLHLSVQSGSDEVLRRMGRRHTRERIRQIWNYAKCQPGGAFFDKKRRPAKPDNYSPRSGEGVFHRNTPHQAVPAITFSWDIICGFPGETDELFNDTLALARELRP
ncbi:MAG: radical SAM protein, partial [Rickettsiales bacterium]|nr:radical SAM protein [Rickettsiales bacterium]